VEGKEVTQKENHRDTTDLLKGKGQETEAQRNTCKEKDHLPQTGKKIRDTFREGCTLKNQGGKGLKGGGKKNLTFLLKKQGDRQDTNSPWGGGHN